MPALNIRGTVIAQRKIHWVPYSLGVFNNQLDPSLWNYSKTNKLLLRNLPKLKLQNTRNVEKHCKPRKPVHILNSRWIETLTLRQVNWLFLSSESTCGMEWGTWMGRAWCGGGGWRMTGGGCLRYAGVAPRGAPPLHGVVPPPPAGLFFPITPFPSHVPMSMLCFPGTIGGGGIPAQHICDWVRTTLFLL